MTSVEHIPRGLPHFAGKTVKQAPEFSLYAVQFLSFFQHGIGRIKRMTINYLPNKTVGRRRLYAKSLALVNATKPDKKHSNS